MNYSSIESDFGPVSAIFDTDTALRCLVFGDTSGFLPFFPSTSLRHDPSLSPLIRAVIEEQKIIPFKVEGTPFQQAVWNELLNIPLGKTVSYQQMANNIKKPSAVRAVATAVGRNPISYLIPCHRVIASNGTLGGYSWGLKIKKDLLRYESYLTTSS